MVFILSLITFQIKYFIEFTINHDRFFFDLTLYGAICSIGSIFVYKLIAICRQHVYPLVSTVRKCLTVCVNVLWFGRHLAFMQWIGIVMLFGGILIEIISNYKLMDKIIPNENTMKK
jgi:UDP-galactose transporter B1